MQGSVFCFILLGITLIAKQSHAFTSFKFKKSIFRGPQVIKAAAARVSMKDVDNKVNELEKRLNESLKLISSSKKESKKFEEMEHRMKQLQKLFKKVMTSKEDAEGKEIKMRKVEDRLKTIERNLSSVPAVQETMDILQTWVAEVSEKTTKEIGKLKKSSRETDQKITNVWTNISDIQQDVHNLIVRLNKGPAGQNNSHSSPDVECPSEYDYIKHVKLCVKFYSDLLPRESAEDRCESVARGGRLVVLNTIEKHRAIQKYLNGKVNRGVFINGKNEKGGYVWSTKQPVSIPWCHGEPTGRRCMSLWGANPYEAFCLDDSWCYNPNPFVCEIAGEGD